MSMLIKGMNMPEHGCTDCDLLHNNYGYYLCPIIGEDVRQNVESGNRHIHCPLVEIPTPHGRLIDTNDVKKSFLYRQGDIFTAFRFYHAVDNAPTIIEAESEEE